MGNLGLCRRVTTMPLKDPEAKRAYDQAYRASHRKQHAAYIAAWRRKNAARFSMYKEEYYRTNREHILETNAAWRQKNPDKIYKYNHKDIESGKHSARSAVRRAMVKGVLTKEDCACGRADVQAHHENYSKPLDVIWMCPMCHSRHHAKGD